MVQSDGPSGLFTMRLPAHLHKSRHGVFYFRIVLPAHLRAMFGGQREIKRSLMTRDPKIAKLSAYSLYVDYQAALGETLKQMAYDPSRFNPNDPSTYPTERKDTPQFEVDVRRGIYKSDPSIPGDTQNMMAFLQFLKTEQPELLNPVPAAEPVDTEKTVQVVKAAVMSAVQTLPQQGGPTTGKRLAESISDWQKDFAEKNNNSKTQSSFASVLKRFLAVVKDIPVCKINADHIRLYRQSRKDTGVKLITVDGDTKTLGRFFEWAKQKGHYPQVELPTHGQTELTKKQRENVAEGAERFTLDELRSIFAADHYRKENTKPHEFWLPLMALYTGARIEELCQLHLSDIYQDKGVLIFDLNDLGGKKLKTKAAKRKVPIHPELVRLGFLDYLEDVKIAAPANKQLFPYLTPTKHGRLSDRASKHFGRYLDTVKLQSRSKVFHSFRDTVNNQLSENGVSIELRCHIVGHDINHVNVKNYSDPPTAERLMNSAISKLCYERTEANGDVSRLELTPLKYEKGAFVGTLQRLMENLQLTSEIQARRVATNQARAERQERIKSRVGRPPKQKSKEPTNA